MFFGLKYKQILTTFIVFNAIISIIHFKNAGKQLKREESAINLIKGYFCECAYFFYKIKKSHCFQLNFFISMLFLIHRALLDTEMFYLDLVVTFLPNCPFFFFFPDIVLYLF